MLVTKTLGHFSLLFVALLEEERKAYRVQVEESNKQINALQGKNFFPHSLGKLYSLDCFCGIIVTNKEKYLVECMYSI